MNSPELEAEIGIDASRLVYLWAQVKRKILAEELNSYQQGVEWIQLVSAHGELFPVSRQQYLDLAHLYAANEADVLSRRHSKCVRDAVLGLYPALCAEAINELNRFLYPRSG